MSIRQGRSAFLLGVATSACNFLKYAITIAMTFQDGFMKKSEDFMKKVHYNLLHF